ncbi:MAG: ECF-type sigma factor [Gemmatimonadaceae bacterium]
MTHAGGVPSSADITGLLLEWSRGNPEALERLMPVIYDECRRIAALQLRHEHRDHTLDPTALVHELYLRLVDQSRATWANRAQFFGIAAQLMRRVLVDYARARHADKRGGSATFCRLQQPLTPRTIRGSLMFWRSTRRSSGWPPSIRNKVRIIELRFFAGLIVEETARLVGRSPRTVKREWRLAKAWLYRELRPEHR